jgi:hypothetical protein
VKAPAEWRIALVALVVCGLTGVAQETAPPFRGTVDLFTIRVQVLAARGRPLPHLAADDFDVRIAGRRRPAVFAELVHEDDGRASTSPTTTVTSENELSERDVEFFKPVMNQASALYVLGLEPQKTDKGQRIVVRVNQRYVSVPRWSWCGDPKCGMPGALRAKP